MTAVIFNAGSFLAIVAMLYYFIKPFCFGKRG